MINDLLLPCTILKYVDDTSIIYEGTNPHPTTYKLQQMLHSHDLLKTFATHTVSLLLATREIIPMSAPCNGSSELLSCDLTVLAHCDPTVYLIVRRADEPIMSRVLAHTFTGMLDPKSLSPG